MLDLSAENPIEHLFFNLTKVSYNIFATMSDEYGKQHVTPTLLAAIVEKVKLECTGSIPSLVDFFSCSLHCEIYSHPWSFCMRRCGFLSL